MIRKWCVMLFALLVIPISCGATGAGGCIRLQMSYNGQPVPGGSVALYLVDEISEEYNLGIVKTPISSLGAPIQTKSVDDQGMVIFSGLDAGQYLLVQTEAARGYYPIKSFLITITSSLDVIEASPKLEPMKKLPQTGQLVWPAWVLLGFGTILIGLGIICRKRE